MDINSEITVSSTPSKSKAPFYIIIFVIIVVLASIIVYYLYFKKPIDCQTGDWSSWSECSKLCGGGTQMRLRKVLTSPKNNGKPCSELEETQNCNVQPCDQDCVVGEWSDWSNCTAKCGGGTQDRSRTVKTPKQSNGKDCPPLKETQLCNTTGCPIDCVVSGWNDWSKVCSQDCGGGELFRERSITTQPTNGGKPCPDLRETKGCNNQPCKIDCVVSDWVQMGDCSSPCGDGDINYERKIITEPKNGGENCPPLKKNIICKKEECSPNWLKIIDYDPSINDNKIRTLDITKYKSVTQLAQNSPYTVLVVLNPISSLVNNEVWFANTSPDGTQTQNQLSQPLNTINPRRGYLHFSTGNFEKYNFFKTKTPTVKININDKIQNLFFTNDNNQVSSLAVYYDPNIKLLDINGRYVTSKIPYDIFPSSNPLHYEMTINKIKIVFELRNYRITALKIKPDENTEYYTNLLTDVKYSDYGTFDGNNLVIYGVDHSNNNTIQIPSPNAGEIINGSVGGKSITQTSNNLLVDILPYQGRF